MQEFWVKNFKNMHDSLIDPLQKHLERAEVSPLMINERAVLIQKEKEKGRMVSSYRHISCLSFIWKLSNGKIYDEI